MVILENTPITKLNVPGNNFYIKRDDLLPFSCGGNKVRIAHEFLEDMKAKGGGAAVPISAGSSQAHAIWKAFHA